MVKDQIQLKIAPQAINFFNRIMEGYEYLGVVTTLDRKAGVVMVRTTPELYDAAIEVIEHLPIPFSYVSADGR